MSIRYRVVAGQDIDEGLVQAWRDIQGTHPWMASPYLSPEFTQTVAQVRRDVFVTVMEDGAKPIGFFPHQKQGSRAVPVAGHLNDCQTIIADPQAGWSATDLLKGSGLSLWDFDHLKIENTPFEPFSHATDVSPVINLKDGFELYAQARKEAGTKRIEKLIRSRRKLERDSGGDGSVRFEALSSNSSVLNQVITWKIEQCERTGTYPYFKDLWTVELVERLLALQSPGCSGALSVLWVNDDIAAAHFGMRSPDIWHYWFPTYDSRWFSYSPGAIQLLDLCQHLCQPEVSQHMIDLGKGDDPYKTSFATEAYELWEGYISHKSAYTKARTAGRSLRDWSRHTPVLEPARRLRAMLKTRR